MLVPSPCSAQVLEVLFDSTNIHGEWARNLVCTADGGYVHSAWNSQQWKVDANGQFAWRQVYSPWHLTYGIAPMPDGGLVQMEGATVSEPLPGVPDTLVFDMVLMRTDASGAVLWSKGLTIPFPGSYMSCADIYTDADLAVDSTGRIFVSAGFTAFSPRQEFIACFDPSGTLLWSKVLLDVPGYSLNSHLAADDAGGCYLVWGYGDGQLFTFNEAFDVVRMNGDGSMAWAAHGTFNFAVRVNSIVVVNGAVVIGGSGYCFGISDFNGFTLKVESDSVITWKRLYRNYDAIAMNHGGWDLSALDNGELITAHYVFYGDLQYHDPVIVRSDAEGNVLNSAQVIHIAQPPYSYHADWRDVQAHGSTVAVAVMRYHYEPWDPDPTAAGLWVLAPDLQGCMLQPITVTNPPAGSGWALIDPLTGTSIADHVISVVDSVVTQVPDAGFAIADFCSLPNAAPEPIDVEDAFQVVADPVDQGAPIVFVSPKAGTIEVFDRSGGRMTSVLIGTPGINAVQTVGWPAGLYLLRGTDRYGAVIGYAKVVVLCNP